MERVLKQPDAGRFPPTLEHGLHQLAPYTRILALGIDGDRANPPDRVALVEEVGADDSPIELGDDAQTEGCGIHIPITPAAASSTGKSLGNRW